MIKTITLKAGRTPSASPEPITLTPVTIFVGPNNSGKSKVLREIGAYCKSGQPANNDVVLGEVKFHSFSKEEAEASIHLFKLPPGPNWMSQRYRHAGMAPLPTPTEQLLQAMMDPDQNTPSFCKYCVDEQTIILDGPERINLADPEPAGDLQRPNSIFQALLLDDAKRAALRQVIYEAIESYLVIDPTDVGNLRLRLSSEPPPSPDIERSWASKSIEFYRKAQPIDSMSDGIKAFTGIMATIIAGDPSVLLIDEPEAFLHPHLAFLLGQDIARTTKGFQKRVFVSTHSPSFVMGCVQSGIPITVIRLTYRDRVATARTLESSALLQLMRDPLLRSSGVLSALFYESVIVTEGDADRAFYSEINERLLQQHRLAGIPNCLFLNAQNWQTIRKIVKPLRELGIAAGGIVDIDVIKEDGRDWSALLDSVFLSESEKQSITALRAAVKKKAEGTGKDMKKQGGIAILDEKDRNAAISLFEGLGKYGLFVVPGGELESWLKYLKASRHGPKWLISIFAKMGEDPGSPTYVRPTSDDVWAFIRGIRKWFTDANRLGIP